MSYVGSDCTFLQTQLILVLQTEIKYIVMSLYVIVPMSIAVTCQILCHAQRLQYIYTRLASIQAILVCHAILQFHCFGYAQSQQRFTRLMFWKAREDFLYVAVDCPGCAADLGC